MRLFPFAQFLISPSQSHENGLHLLRVFPLKTRPQKIAKEVVIAQPPSIRADWQCKQIILDNQIDQTLPVLSFGVERPKSGLAKGRVEFIQQGCSQQEFAHFRRLAIQHLLAR